MGNSLTSDIYDFEQRQKNTRWHSWCNILFYDVKHGLSFVEYKIL